MVEKVSMFGEHTWRHGALDDGRCKGETVTQIGERQGGWRGELQPRRCPIVYVSIGW